MSTDRESKEYFIGGMLWGFLGSAKKAELWLNTPNEDLRGFTPERVASMGEHDRLITVIDEMIERGHKND